MSFHSLVALRPNATQSFVVQVANHYEPDQKATPRHTLTQLLELLRELLLQTRTNSRAMGLDQVLFKKIPTTYSDNKDEYVQVLRKRKCYPLHEFIGKWLQDEYKLDFEDYWGHLRLYRHTDVSSRSPFVGHYIEIPHAILARFFTAMKKRNRCSRTIPPLVQPRLENRLGPEVMNLVGLLVDGQCRYDGELPFLNEPIWSYPEREQEEDSSAVCNAASSVLYYYASE